MIEGREIGGVAGAIILSLPFLLLATLILLTVLGARRARRARDRAPKATTARYGEPITRAPRPRADEGANRGTAVPVPAPSTPVRPRIAETSDLSSVLKSIARAETTSDAAQLSRLYLRLGELKLIMNARGEAADAFRKCIRAAMKADDREAHARSRLELGDMAREAGDLTTACEHWQIARGLYFDLGQKSFLEAVEERMNVHQCPTDWVLNDF